MGSMKPIYLDYAAATPMRKEAIAAMEPFFSKQFFNPSAAYQPAREVRASVENARSAVAQVLGSKKQEVIFTAGGTEANNIAIHGVMKQFPEGNIVVSAIEHESVLEAAKLYDCRIAPVTKEGLIDLKKLDDLIDEKTVLISVMYANNEVGTIQPLKEITKIIATQRSKRVGHFPLYFHSDACQAANYLDLHVSRLGVDLLTLNGGKLYAMKQSGCLYIRSTTTLAPTILGGGQEEGLRSGTESVASLHSFATMLQKAQAERAIESERQRKLRDQLFATLSQKIKGIQLNGHTKKRLPNNINICIEGVEGERLLMELDAAGLLVATGSACTASSDEPSFVLLALGLSVQEASSSLRITLGHQTSETEIKTASDILISCINQHRRLV